MSQIDSIISNKTVQLISQILLGSLFVYASVGKILNPSDFASVISNYKLLPSILIKPTSFALPIIELLLGIFLILNFYPKISAIILCIFLIIFMIAIFSTILRGININCGCFGNLYPESDLPNSNQWILILRDVFFLIIGLIIIFRPKITKKNQLLIRVH